MLYTASGIERVDIAYLFYLNVPSWQLDTLPHSLTVTLFLLQGLPPYVALGFTHSLDLVCIPLTALVHVLQGLHSLQPPLTYKDNECKKKARSNL